MDERPHGPTSALTVDHLIARLETLERAYADLQRAYAALQREARARPRAPLADELRATGPVPWHAAPIPEGGRLDTPVA